MENHSNVVVSPALAPDPRVKATEPLEFPELLHDGPVDSQVHASWAATPNQVVLRYPPTCTVMPKSPSPKGPVSSAAPAETDALTVLVSPGKTSAGGAP